MTPLQEGMFFHSLLQTEYNVYFAQMCYSINADLNVEVVEKSFDELFKRHDILRTAFIQKTTERPLQIVLKERKCSLVYRDISNLENKKEYLQSFKEADAKKAFDLSKDVLMRVSIFKTAGSEFEFVWTHHHILMDGWCLGILVNEFSRLYSGFISNMQPSLPVVTPYSEYIKWLESQNTENATAYWASYIEGYSESSPVPVFLKKEEEAKKYINAKVVLELPPHMVEKIRKNAEKNQVTVNNYFQAVWGILLSKYNNSRDVVFGTVVSGRPPEIEGVSDMIGLFINTIPVRVSYTAGLQFSALLKLTQQKAMESQSYEHFPLSTIQSFSPLKRDLLDHIFVFENFPVVQQIENGSNAEQSAGNPILNVEVTERTHYDFNVIILPHAGLTVRFDFNEACYEKAYVEQIAGCMHHLFEQVIQDENITIDDLRLLPANELSYDTVSAYPGDQVITALFKEQVNANPGQVAVVCEDRKITYSQLDSLSDAIASHLLSKYKVRQGSRVAVMLPRSETAIAVFLAILKAGATYVPLDQLHPSVRLTFMLKDTASVLLISNGTVEKQLETAIPVWNMDREEVLSRVFVPAAAMPPGLAYIMYTSGSTGTPKGVMIEQKGIIRLVKNTNYVHFSPQDKVLGLSNLAFDGSTFDIYGALLNGSTLVMASDLELSDTSRVTKLMEAESISKLFMTTAMFNTLVEDRPDCFKNVKTIVVGGEQLSLPHVKKFIGRYGNGKLVNGYGPTENTTFSTYHEITERDVNRAVIPIGKPISNSAAFVLDHRLHPQPPLAYGEIYVSGDGLAKGYLSDDALTAERFIPDPFCEGKILYKTGDLARLLADGSIDFIGRKDGQVKIRGYRLELAEIRNRLLEFPGIKDAVIAVRQWQQGDKYLVACFTSAEITDVKAIRAFLLQKLPAYAVPAFMMQMERIPLNSNGKVDLAAIPLFERAESGVNEDAPGNELQETLLRIWKDLLETDSLGIRDNFFEFGGHSLKANRLILRIHKELNVRIELRLVFANPTIEQLSGVIAQAERNKFSSVEAVPLKDSYELSHAQKRMWLLSQFKERSAAYHIPCVYSLKGELNVPVFHKALKILVERHESLRTVFRLIDGEPKQVILEPQASGFVLNETDLSSWQADPESHIVAVLQKETSAAFDMENGPLIRTHLLRTSHASHVFVLTLHHIICDGWSLGLIIKELLALYDAFIKEEDSPLQPLTIQYKDYAAWQNGLLAEHGTRAQQNYWMNKLSGRLPEIQLISDRPRPQLKTYNGNTIGLHIDEDTFLQMRTICLKEGVTLYMLLQAVLKVLLYMETGQQDIIIGSPVAGRNHKDLEEQVGLYVNTLAIRDFVNGSDSFTRFLASVKQTVLEAYEHQEYPFDKLVEDLGIVPVGNRQPVFDVFMALQNLGENKINITGIEADYFNFHSDRSSSKFDLNFAFSEAGERLIGSLEYDTDLFDLSTIEVIREQFEWLLKRIVAAQETTIDQLLLRSTDAKDVDFFELNFEN